MALIDDPKGWILQMFEREEREGRGEHCQRFPEGTRLGGLPLNEGEGIYGIYKGKYHFTPAALVIVERGNITRIEWAGVRRCSSQHGEGKTFSNLEMSDGRMVRVRVGDMAQGWSGRISQLFHQLIERHRASSAMGGRLIPAVEFFQKVSDDYSIAPNLDPHPPLTAFREAILELERENDCTKVFMNIFDDEEEWGTDNLVILSSKSEEHFHRFAEVFGADGVLPADEAIKRRLEQVPPGFQVWQVVWD